MCEFSKFLLERLSASCQSLKPYREVPQAHINQFAKYNSCETVVSLELTYNDVAICICMHVATEEKNPAIHAYTDVFLV